MNNNFQQELSNLKSELKIAASQLRQANTLLKNKILLKISALISEKEKEILTANQKDVEKAKKNGRNQAFLDRLALNKESLNDLQNSLKIVANLPDYIGQIEDFKQLENGLKVGRLRIPLGIVGFICEARPSAVVEAAAICLKSGNPVVIKSGRESQKSSAIFGAIMEEALQENNLTKHTISVVSHWGPFELERFLQEKNLLDVVIPRGGESLISFVEQHSQAPVLRHYRGVCHLYVDKGADLDLSLKLILNSKSNRPATCNSLECLLVHQDEAENLLVKLNEVLIKAKIEVRACPKALILMPQAKKATESDWGFEFLDLILAIKVIPSFSSALAHISQFGSNHTEAIVTCDLKRAQDFLAQVDASTVLVNAATRLNDGGVLGLGAEIGISTSKLHAYGPMGLKEMTSTKFIVFGQGHTR